ncbi:MAG: hypothetical protein EA411_04265 [Saprospirales bacterium]|nr:MAG: hypothetical protein EA411_04265 [Saprospirales bacterium]
MQFIFLCTSPQRGAAAMCYGKKPKKSTTPTKEYPVGYIKVTLAKQLTKSQTHPFGRLSA